jgi:adenosylhomocysteine nucleosidase
MNPTVPSSRPLAILSALVDEQRGLIDHLHSREKIDHAGRSFWRGTLDGVPVVLTVSGIGKVAAAVTATLLAERFGAGALLFTGVAGGLAPGVKVGDVVVAEDFIQHDLDVSPLFPRYEVPGSGRSRFACDEALSLSLAQATQEALAQHWPQARMHRGLVASGDRFVCGADESRQLQQRLRQAGHEALAVEMEGAAVAQVCADHGLPFAAMRTISDRADDEAHLDFTSFVQTVASRYAQQILGGLLSRLPRSSLM